MLKKNIYIFLIFLLLSALFWILIALGKTYIYALKCSVEYVNLPKHKSFEQEPIKNLSLKIRTTGYILLSKKLFPSSSVLKIDLAKVVNDDILKINYSSLKANLNNTFGYDIDIINIEPSEVDLQFNKTQQKIVNIIPNIKIEPLQQYMIVGDIKLNPQKVIINGAKNIINNINFVETEYKEVSNIDKNSTFTVDIKKIKGVNYSVPKVYVSARISPYTEINVYKKIIVRNSPNNFRIKLIPDKVQISYFLPTNISIKDSFAVFVDYNNFVKNGKKSKIKLLLSKPDEVKNFKISPEEVDYLIVK